MAGGMLSGEDGFCVAWPSGEFGPMGLGDTVPGRANSPAEGSVELGFSKELAEAQTEGGDVARKELFDGLVASLYEHGSAMNVAMKLDVDDVIDPADTRSWIVAGLEANPIVVRTTKKRPCVSTW